MTLYDLSNKVIAMTASPSSEVVAVVGEWGALYALSTTPPSITLYRERDLHTKMEILFKKNQYDIAVRCDGDNNGDSSDNIGEPTGAID